MKFVYSIQFLKWPHVRMVNQYSKKFVNDGSKSHASDTAYAKELYFFCREYLMKPTNLFSSWIELTKAAFAFFVETLHIHA